MIIEIADCETDGLLKDMTRLWTIQIGSADGDDVTVYADQPGYPPLAEGIERLRKADRVVFHNGMGFDFHVMDRFYPGAVPLEKIYDTLVIGRLIDPEERKQALRDWGERLGVAKGDYEGDFKSFTEDLVKYAHQDIVVTRALYRHLAPQVEDWGMSVWLEHMVAYVISLQEQNGFTLNIEKAVALEAELRQELNDIERELQTIFPPIWVQDKQKGTARVVPKVGNPTGKGPTVKGAEYTRVKLQEFNPGSRHQIAERFIAKYGWEPSKFTPTGVPEINEAILDELPYPEAKPLSRYFRVLKQLGQLSDGDNGWLKLVTPEGRVHGRVNPNGAVTGRMSHFAPNMAQVDKKDLRMREVWEARPGWKLVGCDAEGLEARMLGHYLTKWDKGAFSDRVLNGKKEDGTDIHTVNLKSLKSVLKGSTCTLGLVSRDGAKTYLYAMMYGAGAWKLGWTILEDMREKGVQVPAGALKKKVVTKLGRESKKMLAKGMVGIDKLTEAVGERSKETGFVRGLDGRKIYIRSEHSALNTLLQGAGAIVMKLALVIFHFEYAKDRGWTHGVDFGYCVNCHDEVQAEVRPDISEDFGKSMAEAIAEAGNRLKVKCPLAGAYDIGNNWKETH